MIERLLGIWDIANVLKNMGINDTTTQFMSIILITITILYSTVKPIFSFIKFLVLRKRNKTFLSEYQKYDWYDQQDIIDATKYYVETRFLEESPSETEEPGTDNIKAKRRLLIPFFVNEIFKKDTVDTKYFMIMADSGMGKTTFMINLYLTYKYKLNWVGEKKYNILLVPLADADSLEKIKIDDSEIPNTILLLDALDEDNLAISDYKKRLDEILNKVDRFRKIIITCRTQFFPSKEHEPEIKDKFTYGSKTRSYTFQKLYISPFSEKDIKKYLRKRYGTILRIRNSRYLKALGIVLKTPKLLMRPLLLSYIDELVTANKEIRYSYQIYETLIEKWLDMECDKPYILKKYKSPDEYKQMLVCFSRAMARDLYLNRANRQNKLSINYTEFIDYDGELQLKEYDDNYKKLDKKDRSGRSLLNRNADGEYKFSHKSILEYFLALEVIGNEKFRKDFKFTSDLDTAKKFFLEMMRPGNNIVLSGAENMDKVSLSYKHLLYGLGLNNAEIDKLLSGSKIVQSNALTPGIMIRSYIGSYAFIFMVVIIIAIVAITIVNRYRETVLETLPIEPGKYLPFMGILSIVVAIVLAIHSIFRYRKVKSELKEREN